MSVKIKGLVTLRKKILYHVPKMTARKMHLIGSRLGTTYTLSEEVYGKQTTLQECTRRKRQVGDTGSKWSYQGKVNIFASKKTHSETEYTCATKASNQILFPLSEGTHNDTTVVDCHPISGSFGDLHKGSAPL